MSYYPVPKKAIAVLESSDEKTHGVVYFEEIQDEGTRVFGLIEDATPGLHGFHVHEFGDLRNGCESMGSHYDPFDKYHGPRTVVDEYGNLITNFDRHLGDLGNIQFDENGRAEFNFVDYFIELSGPYSIIGRGLVLHQNEDDLGYPGRRALQSGSLTEKESLKTGNSGKRIACGIIGHL